MTGAKGLGSEWIDWSSIFQLAKAAVPWMKNYIQREAHSRGLDPDAVLPEAQAIWKKCQRAEQEVSQLMSGSPALLFGPFHAIRHLELEVCHEEGSYFLSIFVKMLWCSTSGKFIGRTWREVPLAPEVLQTWCISNVENDIKGRTRMQRGHLVRSQWSWLAPRETSLHSEDVCHACNMLFELSSSANHAPCILNMKIWIDHSCLDETLYDCIQEFYGWVEEFNALFDLQLRFSSAWHSGHRDHADSLARKIHPHVMPLEPMVGHPFNQILNSNSNMNLNSCSKNFTGIVW